MFKSLFNKLFGVKEKNDIIKKTEEVPATEIKKDGPKVVITICRELGSGGRKVARDLADKLNIAYYDKKIITDVAKENGLDEDLFNQVDESELDSFWFDFSKEAYDKDEEHQNFKEITSCDKLFMIQSDAIRRIANKESAVIVGRCSTYILKNKSFKVFICADEKDRIERIMRSYNVDEQKAKDIMIKSDKKRENYHLYYTNQDWKNKSCYDLFINTSETGIDGAVNLIIDAINAKNSNIDK